MLELLEKIIYFIVRSFFYIYFSIFGEPKFNKKINETIEFYDEDNFTGWFKKIRFWDAPYVEVERIITKRGDVTELGCGEGLFSNFLAVSSNKREVKGFDIDKRRIKEASRGIKNATFKKADVTKLKVPKSDTIVMFHLLHHLLSKDAQQKLIKNAVKALKKNGKLVIVEVDNKPFLKYIFTYLVDHVLIAWLFERKIYEPNIFFRSEDEWAKVFAENNLQYKAIPASDNKPFSHIIFVCSKLQTK